jgi:nicotinate-nucleotide adenylyltransferase
LRKRVSLPTPRAIAARLGGHLPPVGARIGLLGGSFNPAHEAHFQISLSALRRLGLDEVWWLVSPLNPLKAAHGMAPIEARLQEARRAARHPRIRACDLEELLGTRYSLDTLRALGTRFPRVTFVWLIGADNLRDLDKWHGWQQILNESIVAVFDRPTYALKALAGRAARRYAAHRIAERRARRLVFCRPPAWIFLHTRQNPLSATAIRSRKGRDRANEQG